MLLITETVTREYRTDLSFDEFRDDHNYKFTSQYPLRARRAGERDQFEPTNRDEAFEAAALSYPGGKEDSRSWVAYRLYETVTEITVETFVQDGEEFTETTTKVTTGRIATVYRDKADWIKQVQEPFEQYKADRIASGEAALDDARFAEFEANKVREEKGEPLVHTAEIAWLEFKGMTVPEYLLPKPVVVSKLQKVLGHLGFRDEN